jgi:hypothetical protein
VNLVTDKVHLTAWRTIGISPTSRANKFPQVQNEHLMMATTQILNKTIDQPNASDRMTLKLTLEF